MRVKLRNPDRTEAVAGPASVRDLLAALDINPETVLVINDGELVTADTVLPDDAEVEVRSVISGGARPRRCRTQASGEDPPCGRAAVIEVERHRRAYCAEHFVDHVRQQIRSAIDRHRMLSYDETVLVAVSGGKDSLALWDALLDMGYRADGLYLGLGIGGYSQRSEAVVRDFADRRGAALHTHDLAAGYGFDIPAASKDPGRSPCGVCGLSKRYVFNRVAVERGYDVMATGHNLDDEAATLLANVLRWQTPFLARQAPCLPGTGEATAAGGTRAGASGATARKVKPLYRLGEREMAAYCVIKGVDYVVEECPMVSGNTVLRYKDALNEIERHSPGTKAQFLFGFLDRVRDEHFAGAADRDGQLVACASCGMPTSQPDHGEPTCAFCRTQGRLLQVLGQSEDRPAPAEPVAGGRR